MTSSVSGKRSPTELIARDSSSVVEVATGIEPVCTALQAVCLTTRPHHHCEQNSLRADDGIRTATSPGKVMRYQLRYIRMLTSDLVDHGARDAR